MSAQSMIAENNPLSESRAKDLPMKFPRSVFVHRCVPLTGVPCDFSLERVGIRRNDSTSQDPVWRPISRQPLKQRVKVAPSRIFSLSAPFLAKTMLHEPISRAQPTPAWLLLVFLGNFCLAFSCFHLPDRYLAKLT